MNNLAPIALFVYNRLNHTKRTINSLVKNELADQSELFIFSDGPKNEASFQEIIKVRKYIKSIKGFKSIKFFEREKNLGLANSVITGINEIFEKYDKVIVLEDDLITSHSFLRFMNDALTFYEENENIWSITGYCHPIDIKHDYNKDVFLSHRVSSWGWATWKKAWKQVKWYDEDYSPYLANKELQKKFGESGEDLPPMLKSQLSKKLDSWAIRWSYAHFKNNKYCLYPVKSFVKSIGDDGSGTHFTKKVTKYDTTLDDGSFNYSFDSDVTFNDDIQKKINNLVKPSLIRRVINYFKFSKLMKS